MSHVLVPWKKGLTLKVCVSREDKQEGGGRAEEKAREGWMLGGTELSTAACNDKLRLHQSFIIKIYLRPDSEGKRIHLLCSALSALQTL